MKDISSNTTLKIAKGCLIIGMAMAWYLYMVNLWPGTVVFLWCLMIGTATWVWVFNVHLIWPKPFSKLYRVQWVSLDTYAQGHGEEMVKKVAKAWAIYGNAKYPRLVHWIEEADHE